MKYRCILASGSPRRRELLGLLGFSYEIIPAESEEIVTSDVPSEVVEELSHQKAKEIFHKLLRDSKEPLIVIGADTVVSYKGNILGKPAGREDAGKMIGMLQGNVHEVYTGVTCFYTDKTGAEVAEADICSFTFSECTRVKCYPMTDAEISAYLDTDEPYDKAGAYGIQGLFGKHISGIEGDYNNVVGLPVARLYKEMKDHNLL